MTSLSILLTSAVVVLAALLVLLVRNREGLTRRIRALFRRPPRPPKPPGPDHYYKRYWS